MTRTFAAIAIALFAGILSLAGRHNHAIAQTAAPQSAPANTAEAAAAPARTAVIVFDGSGSMWGRIDGDKTAKFNLVRDALKTSLATPPAPGTRLGLMSFGYRRQGDCSDVGVISQPAPATADFIAERIIAPLEKLNPKGKGPLTLALKEAAKVLGTSPGKNSLVVVHDGPDNCGLDPCAALVELQETSPGLTISVVGIALDEAEASTYQCLTKATRGRHVDVRNASDIPAAIDAVTKLALYDAPAVTAAAPSAEQKSIIPPAPVAIDLARDGPPHLRLHALLAAGKPASTDRPIRWTVRAEAAAPDARVRTFTGQGVLVPVTEGAASGTHVVIAEDGLARAQVSVTAPAKGHLLAEVQLNAGFARLTGPPDPNAVLAVFERKVQPATAATTPASAPPAASSAAPPAAALPGKPLGIFAAGTSIVALPVGNYLLRLDRGSQRTERAVEIKPAATADVDFGAYAVIEATLGQRIADDGKDGRASRPVILSIEEDDPLGPRGRREIARAAGPIAEFTVPPGTYTLVASQGPLEVRERVAVTAAERVSRVLPLASSRLMLALRDPAANPANATGPRVWYRIERLDIAGTEPMHAFDTSPIIDVPPGRYRIVGHTAGTAIQATTEIDIGLGETRAVVLAPLAGSLSVSAGGKTQGPVSWQITDAQGSRVWLPPPATSAGDRTVTLAPGRYTVRALTSTTDSESQIDIKSGEHRTLAIGQ